MKSTRRDFVKRTALLGGGALLLSVGPHSVAAADNQGSAPQNPTLETLHNLRSIHGNFSERALPEGAVEIILQACVRAANASNNQSYSIIVIKDRKLAREVCGYQGGCLLLFCADYNRLKSSTTALGYRYEPGTIVDFLTATINASLAAQTAVIAAKSLQIDSLLTNGIHRGNIERHWKLLELPATHCFPVIALVLGYPTKEPSHRRGRLSGTGVVHEEKYHALSAQELEYLSGCYDDKSRHLGQIEDWESKGYKHYLDWYFKEWVGVDKKRPAGETAMLERLRKSGFVEANLP